MAGGSMEVNERPLRASRSVGVWTSQSSRLGTFPQTNGEFMDAQKIASFTAGLARNTMRRRIALSEPKCRLANRRKKHKLVMPRNDVLS